MVGLIFSLLFALVQQWPEPGKVVSTVDKAEDFSAIRSFAWERGIEAADRDAHKLILAAIEAELAARGIKLAADSQSAEVIVRYDGLASDPVNLDELRRRSMKDPNAVPPTQVLGSLAISMHRNRRTTQMWTAHARELIDASPGARDASIKKIVARVFETYPKRPTP
jgi:hypothetical protein